MTSYLLLLASSVLVGLLLVVCESGIKAIGSPVRVSLTRIALIIIAFCNITVVIFLFINHADFPLNMEIMEGTILQHVRQAAALEPIYPAPTPSFVPLSYNPLYYVLAIPFTMAFGSSLLTLRIMTVFGTLGSAYILYQIIVKKTQSRWWGLMAIGLFGASYDAMDHFFDVAHPDMLMLFTALLGSYIIDTKRSRFWNCIAILLFLMAFWLKQHGALFVIGGVAYLTYREGGKRSIPYWALAAVLGPVLYVLAGEPLFGTHFHYFTWEMPRNWTELSVGNLLVFPKYVVRFYPLLAGVVVLCGVLKFRNKKSKKDIWTFQFVPALLCGFLGALDSGSSFNNYIPMATWFVLLGVLCLARLREDVHGGRAGKLVELGLVVSFGALLYNPLAVVIPRESERKYADLVGMLSGCPGTVYGPSIGQLPRDYVLYPAAHWVALEDMIRGPGRDTRNHPNTRRLLEPAIHPGGEAFILAYLPLTNYPWLAFLEDYYVLERDYGDYYKSLGVLKVRWDHGWPRYLYRYSPAKAAAAGR